MGWVPKSPRPSDFCGCPPCPMCFVYVTDSGEQIDGIEQMRRELAPQLPVPPPYVDVPEPPPYVEVPERDPLTRAATGRMIRVPVPPNLSVPLPDEIRQRQQLAEAAQRIHEANLRQAPGSALEPFREAIDTEAAQRSAEFFLRQRRREAARAPRPPRRPVLDELQIEEPPAKKTQGRIVEMTLDEFARQRAMRALQIEAERQAAARLGTAASPYVVYDAQTDQYVPNLGNGTWNTWKVTT